MFDWTEGTEDVVDIVAVSVQKGFGFLQGLFDDGPSDADSVAHCGGHVLSFGTRTLSDAQWELDRLHAEMVHATGSKYDALKDKVRELEKLVARYFESDGYEKKQLEDNIYDLAHRK